MTTKTRAATRPRPPKDFDESAPLPDAMLRKMRPAADVVPAIVSAAKRAPGRPKTENAKVPISLRLPPDLVAAYKATGAGWQGRMNDALVDGAAKLGAKK
jgi:uncharacterized protein (DUF4415 family)